MDLVDGFTLFSGAGLVPPAGAWRLLELLPSNKVGECVWNRRDMTVHAGGLDHCENEC